MQPCPQCKRHLKIGEIACPFCGTRRLSRAALLASVALASPACWTNASSTPTTTPENTQTTTTAATGVVTGIVTAGPGEPLADYTVTLLGPDGGERTAASDSKGRYTFTDLPPGTYKLLVPSNNRRRPNDERAVIVKSGETVQQDFATANRDLDQRLKMPYGAPPAPRRVV